MRKKWWKGKKKNNFASKYNQFLKLKFGSKLTFKKYLKQQPYYILIYIFYDNFFRGKGKSLFNVGKELFTPYKDIKNFHYIIEKLFSWQVFKNYSNDNFIFKLLKVFSTSTQREKFYNFLKDKKNKKKELIFLINKVALKLEICFFSILYKKYNKLFDSQTKNYFQQLFFILHNTYLKCDLTNNSLSSKRILKRYKALYKFFYIISNSYIKKLKTQVRMYRTTKSLEFKFTKFLLQKISPKMSSLPIRKKKLFLKFKKRKKPNKVFKSRYIKRYIKKKWLKKKKGRHLKSFFDIFLNYDVFTYLREALEAEKGMATIKKELKVFLIKTNKWRKSFQTKLNYSLKKKIYWKKKKEYEFLYKWSLSSSYFTFLILQYFDTEDEISRLDLYERIYNYHKVRLLRLNFIAKILHSRIFYWRDNYHPLVKYRWNRRVRRKLKAMKKKFRKRPRKLTRLSTDEKSYYIIRDWKKKLYQQRYFSFSIERKKNFLRKKIKRLKKLFKVDLNKNMRRQKKRAILFFHPKYSNYYISLLDMQYKPVTIWSAGKVLDSWVNQKKVKLSTVYCNFVFRKFLRILRKFRIKILYFEIKNTFDKHFRAAYRFFSSRGFKIPIIKIDRRIPHHLGLKKRKLRRI